MIHGKSPVIQVLISVAACIGIAASASGVAVCGDWTIVPNPTIDGQETIPVMILAFAPDSAIGFRMGYNAAGEVSVLRMDWDGTAWTFTSADPLTGLDNSWDLRAVFGSVPDDIWGTGLLSVDSFHGVPFLAHYDGQEWTAFEGTIFDDPNPEGGDPVRSAEGSHLAVIAPDDIWVLGVGDSPQKTSSSPVACHWDGSNLEEYSPQLQPLYGRLNRVEGVSAAGPDAVWVVGSGRNLSGAFHMYTYHWDGTVWTPVTSWTPLPGQNILQDFLKGVVAFAPDDVWAVGDKLLLEDGVTHAASLYLHWDGSGWTEVEGPDVGPLTSVAGSAPDNIWASCAYGEYGGRMAHWDGTSWTEVSTASIPSATHIGLSRLAASPTGDVWALGYWGIYDGAGGWEEFHDLLETFTPVCPGDLDGNGQVDLVDFATFSTCYGMAAPIGACGPAEFEGCDLDGNGVVNLLDFATFAADFDG